MTKLNRSVERSIKIIETVSKSGVCSLALLADETGLPKATILRICATLISQGWLSQNQNDKRYRMGSRFPRLDAKPDFADTFVEAGKLKIVALSQSTGLAVDLAVSIGNGRLEIVDTTRKFSLHGISADTIGYRPSPFRSALGSAFLAELSTQEATAYFIKSTEYTTGRDRAAALKFSPKLQEIRKNGFATREEGYWGRAVDYGGIPRAIGVAIKVNGQVMGAISLVWLAEKHSMASVVDEHLAQLTNTARVIGDRLSSEREHGTMSN